MKVPEFRYEFIPAGTKRRSGYKLLTDKPAYVDHDTGNPNSTAAGNVGYFIRSCNEMSASAHIFIDDKETIICIPAIPTDGKMEKAWHVLYNVTTDNELWGDDSNDIAIGGELCFFPNDPERTRKAYERYVEFMAWHAYISGADPRRRAGHYMLDPARKVDPKTALAVIGLTYKDMTDAIYDTYISEYIEKPDEDRPDPNKPASYAIEAQAWVRVEGISDGNRCYDYTTREEIWVMLYRILVGKEKNFEQARQWAINTGVSDGKRPKDNVLRVELWSMLSRSVGGLTVGDDWKSEGNIWVVKNGISDGLNPDFKAERQQLWVMLMRCSNKLFF